MRNKEPELTEIEKVLQPVKDQDERLKALHKLAGAFHTAGCPAVDCKGFCTCSEDASLHKDLKDLAMAFVSTHMSSATDAERLIFAYVFFSALEKAWRLGHKHFAESDPQLRELAKEWLSMSTNFHIDPMVSMEESLFNLLKQVEDKAWMRLSEARTKQWDKLEALLGVKGGSAVVAAVEELVAKKQ